MRRMDRWIRAWAKQQLKQSLETLGAVTGQRSCQPLRDTGENQCLGPHSSVTAGILPKGRGGEGVETTVKTTKIYLLQITNLNQIVQLRAKLRHAGKAPSAWSVGVLWACSQVLCHLSTVVPGEAGTTPSCRHLAVTEKSIQVSLTSLTDPRQHSSIHLLSGSGRSGGSLSRGIVTCHAAADSAVSSHAHTGTAPLQRTPRPYAQRARPCSPEPCTQHLGAEDAGKHSTGSWARASAQTGHGPCSPPIAGAHLCP